MRWVVFVPRAVALFGTLRHFATRFANLGFRGTANPLRESGQSQQRGRLFGEIDVRVDVHRQSDVGVPSKLLRDLGRNSGPSQIRNERVAVRVKVGVSPLSVSIREKIGLGSLQPFRLGVGILDPSRARPFEVLPHHLFGLPFDAARDLARNTEQ
ncbi:MAG: hypothetical protein U0935_20310 [Pirellulales bacterium]